MHLNANNEYGRQDHELATVALNVRVAEDAEKQSLRLETRIDNLLSIVDEQRRLAAKLDGQTETLIGLTRWLKGLTVGLFVLTLVLCAFEARHFFESVSAPSSAHMLNAPPPTRSVVLPAPVIAPPRPPIATNQLVSSNTQPSQAAPPP